MAVYPDERQLIMIDILLVPNLFKKMKLEENSAAFICGSYPHSTVYDLLYMLS